MPWSLHSHGRGLQAEPPGLVDKSVPSMPTTICVSPISSGRHGSCHTSSLRRAATRAGAILERTKCLQNSEDVDMRSSASTSNAQSRLPSDTLKPLSL